MFYPKNTEKEEFEEKGTALLLAYYDIILDGAGCLKEAKIIEKDKKATGVKWFAFAMTPENSVWFNNS